MIPTFNTCKPDQTALAALAQWRSNFLLSAINGDADWLAGYQAAKQQGLLAAQRMDAPRIEPFPSWHPVS